MQEADVTDAPEPASGGVWDLDIVVNVQTGVSCVDLPHFSQQRPVQGTKPARKSLLKLLGGMYNDVCPLHWREEHADDGTPDPYHSVAPGWSTLSGGRKPYIMTLPMELVEKLTRAANCVPLVRSVRVFVVDAQAVKRRVTIEELRDMNVQLQPVPNLYQRRAVAAASAGSSAQHAAAAQPPAELGSVLERQRMLEEQLAAMKALMEQMVRTTAVAAAPAAPPAAAPAPAAGPAPPEVPAPAPAPPAAPGKRRRDL